MPEPDKFVANMLVASAPAYASAASARLLQQHPSVPEHFGPGSWSSWKTHYLQRIHELAAAVACGAPEVFAGRIAWVRQAFVCRSVPEEDLRHSLHCLREVLDSELPDPARAAVMPALAAGLDALEGPVQPDQCVLSGDTKAGRVALAYLVAALEGDGKRAIETVTAAIDDGFDLRDAHSSIVVPVQKELGRMWHAGELSVAQEHLVTSTTQRLLYVLGAASPPVKPNGLKALLAGVSGDVHDIALRSLANLLEMDGWQVLCLGGDVPDTEIAAAADYFVADVLMLSATLAQHLLAVTRTIASIRQLDGRRIPVIVGGLAYEGTGDLWRRQGAAGYAREFGEAVRLAASIAAGATPAT